MWDYLPGLINKMSGTSSTDFVTAPASRGETQQSVIKLETQQLRKLRACLEEKLSQLANKRKCEFDNRTPSVRKVVTSRAVLVKAPKLVRHPVIKP